MTAPSRLFIISRPRSRLRYIILSLVLCAISYTIQSDLELTSIFGRRLRSRRQLTYLDPLPSRPIPYSRSLINQNYQSLLQPSAIDSALFKKEIQQAQQIAGGSKGYDDESMCDNVFLFMPQQFAHNGHGSQLNSYLLASMIATFTNRAMVILEPPPKLNVFKSNSQFGCPPEAWKTVMVRAGGEPRKVGWNPDFPRGLNRLVKHAEWLSRRCPVPCQGTFGYEDWDEFRLANNATEVPIPQELQCRNNNDDKQTNVIVMGGQEVRDYFISHYKDKMILRIQPPSLPGAEWALRLGAAPHEARIFGSLTDRRDIWDYVSALMARSGVLRFQHWIARDVEIFIQKHTELPLDVPYDAIHVRRGDKLESDAKRHVIKHWRALDMYDEETKSMPRNYIPFTHYLSQFDDLPCEDSEEGSPRLVYVATDDPIEILNEINDLPKDSKGNTLTSNADGVVCHKFQFVLSSFEQDVGFHIDAGGSKGACEDRYSRNIASVADLMILAKSNIFVGEFNSNWGRLVRSFRLSMNDSAKIMNGARPVLQREMRVAWGNLRPGPPGW